MKTLISGIYFITHLVSGRVYVGQSNNVRKRITIHRSLLRRGKHQNQRLQRAWDKYGEDAFDFEVLILAPLWALDSLEQAYLDDPETSHFNIAKDAAVVGRGRALSVETRAKISSSMRGRPGRSLSAEDKAKISAANKGRKLGLRSSEHCAKISAANSGRSLSVEHKAKLSKALTGRVLGPQSKDHKAKLSEAMSGRKHSPEAKAKMIESKRRMRLTRRSSAL